MNNIVRDPLEVKCSDNSYLIDVLDLCRLLVGKGFRSPMYRCVNYFELFKVNKYNEPIDVIRLTEHFVDKDSRDYGRYYTTDRETYDKINAWKKEVEQYD